MAASKWNGRNTFRKSLSASSSCSLWHSTGRTVILITHSVEEAVLLGSRVLVMSPRPGRIVLDLPIGFSRTDASTSELRTRPDFAATAHRVRATIAQGIP